ncbi:MAG TPA: hypothetical protein VMZ71_09195 [Gemmataceae bacterium]|nr:hypothetical protein [Gemmataceae bacterium]
MTSPVVYADFMNADPQGRLRLNGVGTLNDLGDSGLRLADGLRILVHDEEVEADGVVTYSDQEKLWVAAIDWNAIRPFQKLAVATHN